MPSCEWAPVHSPVPITSCNFNPHRSHARGADLPLNTDLLCFGDCDDCLLDSNRVCVDRLRCCPDGSRVRRAYAADSKRSDGACHSRWAGSAFWPASRKRVGSLTEASLRILVRKNVAHLHDMLKANIGFGMHLCHFMLHYHREEDNSM